MQKIIKETMEDKNTFLCKTYKISFTFTLLFYEIYSKIRIAYRQDIIVSQEQLAKYFVK